jgi:hypothetical protein
MMPSTDDSNLINYQYVSPPTFDTALNLLKNLRNVELAVEEIKNVLKEGDSTIDPFQKQVLSHFCNNQDEISTACTLFILNGGDLNSANINETNLNTAFYTPNFPQNLVKDLQAELVNRYPQIGNSTFNYFGNSLSTSANTPMLCLVNYLLDSSLPALEAWHNKVKTALSRPLNLNS